MAISGTGAGDLSTERVNDYLVDYMRDAAAPVTAGALEDRLLGLGLMTRTGERAACTIAGLVLFGRTPRRALPQAGIRWMVFEGETQQYRALADDVLDGPLVGLTRRTDEGANETIEPGLLERLVTHLEPFISTEADTVGEDLRRTRRWHYPIEALREALVNAMVHRDWTRSLEVEVVVFSDRLEITSPGALHNSMSIEKMLAGQRSPRNPQIVDVMRDYGYVDARGMGVRRKIVPLVKGVRFEVTDDHVRVIMPKAAAEATRDALAERDV